MSNQGENIQVKFVLQGYRVRVKVTAAMFDGKRQVCCTINFYWLDYLLANSLRSLCNTKRCDVHIIVNVHSVSDQLPAK